MEACHSTCCESAKIVEYARSSILFLKYVRCVYSKPRALLKHCLLSPCDLLLKLAEQFLLCLVSRVYIPLWLEALDGRAYLRLQILLERGRVDEISALVHVPLRNGQEGK